jgi:DNA-binding GntR family transcriptional regulator
MQLSAIGLIEFRPRRGAVVADHGPKYVFEMFEVMAELEGMAGALAARRHTPDDKDLLLSAHDRCQEAANNEDTDAYYYENEAFHHAIYSASQNSFLTEQCAFLHRRLRPYRRLQLRVRNRMKASFDEHQAIIENILGGDAEATRALLLAHVKVQGDRFSDLVANLDHIRIKATKDR